MSRNDALKVKQMKSVCDTSSECANKTERVGEWVSEWVSE